MSSRFGRNKRRQAREEIAKADRRTEYWISRAHRAEMAEGRLARRLHSAIEVKVDALFVPSEDLHRARTVLQYRTGRIGHEVGLERHQIEESREAKATFAKRVAEIVAEKLLAYMEQGGRFG